jgi:hypothetical protein
VQNPAISVSSDAVPDGDARTLVPADPVAEAERKAVLDLVAVGSLDGLHV